MDWRDHAACRDVDPELFFPVGKSGPALEQVEKAKSICWRCPVSAPCRDWAIATAQDGGIWGGLTEDERRVALRRSGHAGSALRAEPGTRRRLPDGASGQRRRPTGTAPRPGGRVA